MNRYNEVVNAQPKEPVGLRRSLGLPMITFYGVGTIVGGGFYALTGKVVGEAGMLTPAAFLVASLIAMLSAFSFAELSARFPVSAGEAYYVRQAFGHRWLSTVVGWLVIVTGVVSAATLADAFALFAQRFTTLPSWIVIIAIVSMLGLVTAWGIRESAWLSLVITIIEVGGLALILLAGAGSFSALPERIGEFTPSLNWDDGAAVLMGAYLAFYSFVGFEDMVNVAEEVKQPRRNLPLAILLSLGISALLYVLISVVLVLSVPAATLAESRSPLSLVFGDRRYAVDAITVVGMLAGINGALVQIVMSTRVAYGLSRERQAPAILRRIHPRTQTPLPATALMTGVVIALALWLPLTSLAKLTSSVLLIVYAFVNASLWQVKRRRLEAPDDVTCYPIWLPILGTITCLALVLFQIASIFV